MLLKRKKMENYMEKKTFLFRSGLRLIILIIQEFKIPSLPILAKFDQRWLTLTGISQIVDFLI